MPIFVIFTQCYKNLNFEFESKLFFDDEYRKDLVIKMDYPSLL